MNYELHSLYNSVLSLVLFCIHYMLYFINEEKVHMEAIVKLL